MNFLQKLFAPATSQAPANQLPMERKSATYTSVNLAQDIGWGGYDECSHEVQNVKRGAKLRMQAAINYYLTVAPVQIAINRIVTGLEGLKLTFYDDQERVYDLSNPVLELLRSPSADISGNEFIRALAAFYKITGNAYLLATGAPHKPPSELYVINPACVQVETGYDGLAARMTVTGIDNHGGQEIFTRHEENAAARQSRFRFFSTGGAGDHRELYQIRNFNPRIGECNLQGESGLSAIQMEILEYRQSGLHNLSIVDNGARPSGAFTMPNGEQAPPLSAEQLERLRAQIDAFYSGANNAGRPLLLEGGLDFRQMSLTQKDMEFSQMRQAAEEKIYKALGVPLPLVTQTAATMDNIANAREMLYDDAILPLADTLLLELSNFLQPRYGWSDSQMITYDPDAIPALKNRRMRELKATSDLGILTINEMREKLGQEAIDGGDTLYQPMNLVPIGSSPVPPETGTEEAKHTVSRDRFTAVMRGQLDTKGERLYTDTQIATLADQEGLT